MIFDILDGMKIYVMPGNTLGWTLFLYLYYIIADILPTILFLILYVPDEKNAD